MLHCQHCSEVLELRAEHSHNNKCLSLNVTSRVLKIVKNRTIRKFQAVSLFCIFIGPACSLPLQTAYNNKIPKKVHGKVSSKPVNVQSPAELIHTEQRLSSFF